MAKLEQGKAVALTGKTIVLWVTFADPNTKGELLTVKQNQSGGYDTIAFAGRHEGIAIFSSSAVDQIGEKAVPEVDLAGGDPVQVCVVYDGDAVKTYIDGNMCGMYRCESAVELDEQCTVIMGTSQRHMDSFCGFITGVRIYDAALDHEEILTLRPEKLEIPRLWACWLFDENCLSERTGRFRAHKMIGGSRVSGDVLVMDDRFCSVLCAQSNQQLEALCPVLAVDYQDVAAARRLRSSLVADPYRPAYHFVTPEGVHSPFDPNGALYWKGRYHLMYIVQTEKGHCWAHVSSTDLLHWRHHPLALEPDDSDEGIFSGGAFVDKNGVPTITYWGLGTPRGVCIATSTDEDLEQWQKSIHNPVIKETQHGLAAIKNQNGDYEAIYGVADPSPIWIHDGRYYMLTGNLLVLWEFGQKRNMPEYLGDRLFLFGSDDLINWEYLGPFYQSDRKWTDVSEDNMCPEFFPLPGSKEGGKPSGKYMILFISHNRGCQYYIGDYRDNRFYPETHGRMSWVDKTFFAPESLVDTKGRRIMWAWMHDGRRRLTQIASGWSGVMSLPRQLWLRNENELGIAPIDELKQLRYAEQDLGSVEVGPNEEVVLETIAGNTIELELEVEPGDAVEFGVKVCRSPGGEEETCVCYDGKYCALKIDATRSSLSAEGPKNVESAPLTLDSHEPLHLRIFVDKSIVEAFANDRQALVRNIYPTRPDSVGVSVFAKGGHAQIKSLRAWKISPTNPY